MVVNFERGPRSNSLLFRFARLVRVSVRTFLRAKMAWKYAGFGGLAFLFWHFGIFSLFHALMASFIVYLLTGGWKFWRIVIKTAPRDLRAGAYLLKAIRIMKTHAENNENVVTLFEKNVRKNPNKLALVMVDGKEWTYREVDECSNAFANYLHNEGYKAGDVVALYMENRPEYACFWLGMSKIGVIGALINFNLKSDSLAHCIKISEAKGMIYSGDYAKELQPIKHQLPAEMKLYCYGNYDASVLEAIHLDQALSHSSTMTPPRSHVTKFSDKLFYIYTSGTTGLPKAAIVIHSRFFYMAYSTHLFFNMNENDVIYDTLPLYHTAGGVVGMGQCFIMGCTVVIRKKFSASRFWDDCIKYNCSAMQYIGEICRYLLSQPPKSTDRMHRVRCAFGNGLKPQIWSQFCQRFDIKWVGEFYGATEGNANILNPDNTEGAVGFLTQIAPSVYPITIIRVNEETGELLRDADGLCMRCQAGEPGELVGKIVKGDPLREFDGYVNKEATKKKIAQNVFNHGDSFFLTGDILVMDELGYLYFRDRTGDTFRWKGENVSTNEVEAVISNILKLQDSTVYGVEIPGTDGRAGMAAIVDSEHTVDMKKLCTDLMAGLPAYALPIFVRILPELEVTGTFKLRKTDYRKEAFDPSRVKKDKIYYLDMKNKEYQPIDQQVYQDIMDGKLRF